MTGNLVDFTLPFSLYHHVICLLFFLISRNRKTKITVDCIPGSATVPPNSWTTGLGYYLAPKIRHFRFNLMGVRKWTPLFFPIYHLRPPVPDHSPQTLNKTRYPPFCCCPKSSTGKRRGDVSKFTLINFLYLILRVKRKGCWKVFIQSRGAEFGGNWWERNNTTSGAPASFQLNLYHIKCICHEGFL